MPEPISTSAAIMGGSSLLGGALAASGASDAAETQAGAARDAAALQKDIFDRQMAGQEPYRQAGLVGQARLMELLGLRMPAQAGGGVGGGWTETRAHLENGHQWHQQRCRLC